MDYYDDLFDKNMSTFQLMTVFNKAVEGENKSQIQELLKSHNKFHDLALARELKLSQTMIID